MRVIFTYPWVYLLLFVSAIGCQSSPTAGGRNEDATPADHAATDSATSLAQATATTPEGKPIITARTYLQQSLKEDLEKGIIDSFSRRFVVEPYDLNDDGTEELFVGLTGPYFCGSGGCTFLLLTDAGELITRFTVSGYPVRILSYKNRGWKDLLVESSSNLHRVAFDGQRYPSNPSVLPIVAEVPATVRDTVLDKTGPSDDWEVF